MIITKEKKKTVKKIKYNGNDNYFVRTINEIDERINNYGRENLSRGEDLRFTINYLDRLNLNCVFAFTDTLYHYNKLTNTNLMSNIDIETINNSIENLLLIRDIAITKLVL